MESKSLLDLSPSVRHVATYAQGHLTMEQRPGLPRGSGAESDRYEELIVNPTLLELLKRRGDIDCGGLEYVIVSYGHFNELILPTLNGHVSIAIEKDADPRDFVEMARDVIQ